MANKYTVGPIIKRTNLTPTGAFVDVYEVNFTTVSGVQSSVLIPVAEFTTDNAKNQIENLVDVLESVSNL